jgi:hypothetical protein
MTKDEIANDLAYVRSLAEEGRHAPLIGGGFLVFFGVVLSVAYAIQWAFLTDLFGRVPGEAYGYLWLGYGVVATLGGIAGGLRVSKLPGAASVVNRVDRAVWQSVSLGICVVVAGCIWRMVSAQDWTAPNAIMAAAYAMFGIALNVTASISNYKWLRIFALLAFAVSVPMWVYRDEPWAYLMAAIAGIVVLVVPGVTMMRREPSPIA